MEQFYKFLQASPLLEQGVKAFVIILIVILANIAFGIILYIYDKRTSDKHPIFGFIYKSVRKPLRFIVWVIGLWVMFTQVLNWKDKNIDIVLTASVIALKLAIVIAITWMLFDFAKHTKNYFIKKQTRTDGGYNDFSIIETSHKAAQVMIIFIVIFATLNVLHISIVALAGVTTVAAGFFAISQQDLIKNLFGGIVLHLDRPFSVGDWIYTVDGKIQGTVKKISFRLTKLQAFDSRPIYVPNATFLTEAVVNASRMTNRRILQYAGIRYCDFSKLSTIMTDIKNMLANHPEIDQKLTTLVCVVNGSTDMGSSTEGVFGTTSLNFMVYTFTKTTNWAKFQDIQSSIMIEIGQIILNNQAEIAFPTTTIDLPEETLRALSTQA